MRASPRGILATLLVLVVASICVRLGFWQLDRLAQRRAVNAAAAAGSELPPLALDSAGLAAMEGRPELFPYRRAVAHGRYDTDRELLLRGRSDTGRPGVHLVVPLRLEGSNAVILVNRGWLSAPDAATVDPRPYRVSGPVEVVGLLQLLPDSAADASPLEVEVDGFVIQTYRRLNRTVLSRAYDTVLPPLYLQATGDRVGRTPVPVPPPAFDEGPHFAYAVQWFAFATIAVVGLLVLLLRKR